MDYLTLLIEAISRKSFHLHPGLDPAHYEITASMRDAPTKWRAYCHHGFTATNPKDSVHEGTMGGVGYVMISLIDDTIIPINRGDEHHRGYDLLYDLAKSSRKRGFEIRVDNFIPIGSYGSNYIYSKSEIPKMLIALRKYLSYGGIDGPLQGTSELNMVLNSSQFVAQKGDVDIKPHELAPAGQHIFDSFAALAKVFENARSDPSASAFGKAFQAAAKFCVGLRPFLSYLAIDEDDYAILYKPEILDRLKKSRDLQTLEKAFFGFNGLKNAIHNALRRYVARQAAGERDAWNDNHIKALWGDVALAVDKLGTI